MSNFIRLAAIGLLAAVVGCTVSVPGGNANGNSNSSNANTSGNSNSVGNENDNAAAAPTSFSADLSGANEVPPVETATTGSAILNVAGDNEAIAVRLLVENGVGITQAHIHLGQPDENGSVVASLFQAQGGPMDINGLLASVRLTADLLTGSLTGMTIADLLDEIIAGNAYVNVHTSAHGGGEVRGQIEVAGQ